MANWQSKLDLKDVWNKVSKEITLQELSKIIAKRLRKLKPTKDKGILEERDDIADEFEGLSLDKNAGFNDFDSIMERLYNWGDIKLNNSFPPDKICWIATNF